MRIAVLVGVVLQGGCYDFSGLEPCELNPRACELEFHGITPARAPANASSLRAVIEGTGFERDTRVSLGLGSAFIRSVTPTRLELEIFSSRPGVSDLHLWSGVRYLHVPAALEWVESGENP